MIKKKIILASSSPRRKELLSKLGIDFEVMDSGYMEDMNLKMKPTALAKYLSMGKAKAVAMKNNNCIIIAADTFVVLDGKIIGKPNSKDLAIKMLLNLNNRTVQIITGLSIMDTYSNKNFSEIVIGKVKFRKFSKSEAKNYIKHGESLDRAGAFAVQGLGAVLIERVTGDFNSIMGLPLFKVAKILNKLGVKIL